MKCMASHVTIKQQQQQQQLLSQAQLSQLAGFPQSSLGSLSSLGALGSLSSMTTGDLFNPGQLRQGVQPRSQPQIGQAFDIGSILQP
eukprot:m.161905 g.161905  ORF g.161905 m.161905 type:complete len:87 (-) comp14367_c7_seq1:1007-1267(-)